MKKYLAYIISGLAVMLLGPSCIKQIDKTFKGDTVIEIDAAPLNPVTSPFTHPVLLQVPRDAFPVIVPTSNCSNSATVEPFIKRTTGTVKLRVNLVGPVQGSNREIEVTTFPIAAQLPSITFRQLSPCSNVTLTTADAVAGTHFNLATNKVVIPSGSSFGFIDVTILNPGATAGQTRVIGFELKETTTAKPSQNYKKIAIAIDQR